MDIERAINDDRAVSPVIGVILMVAITVILAAVIGTFVLGMSDQMGDTTPRASFGMSIGGNNGDQVTITHETGASMSPSNVVVSSNQAFTGPAAGSSGSTWETLTGASTDISAGSSLTITGDDGAGGTASFEGDTVRVIYSSPDSDSSTTLQKKTFN